MPSWYQADLFESRELVEQHTQHHLVRLCWQICEEENLVRRRIVNALSGAPAAGKAGPPGAATFPFLLF